MLQLTKDQMDRALANKREAVENAIADWMIGEFSAAQTQRVTILEAVHKIAATAWSWNIESGELVRLHVYISKVIGLDYYVVMPELGEVLQDKTIRDDVKLTYLSGWLDAFKARVDAVHNTLSSKQV